MGVVLVVGMREGRGPDREGLSGPVENDEDARIFVDLYPSLRRFAGAVRPSTMDADDLVQEALVRTLSVRRLSDCDNPGAYLRTAIVRLAGDQRRRVGRWRNVETRLGAGQEEGSENYPSDLEELRRLAPRDRAVLYLVVVEGLTYRAAAKILGCSEDAARVRASRALRRLRVELTAEMRDE